MVDPKRRGLEVVKLEDCGSSVKFPAEPIDVLPWDAGHPEIVEEMYDGCTRESALDVEEEDSYYITASPLVFDSSRDVVNSIGRSASWEPTKVVLRE